ncbi:MAG: hypothetical protein V7L30_11770 [Nostoc sp.]|uniref:hypothetical protein n=1 Tax=Nostoc sp. TaxID=1180 RepID=UPI002FF72FB6
MNTKLTLSNIRYLHLLVLISVLFILTLNIPLISFFIFIVYFLLVFIFAALQLLDNKVNTFKKALLNKSFVRVFLVIIFFALSYFITILNYNYIDKTTAIHSIILTVISYFIGYSINIEKLPDKPFNFIYLVLALIGGGVIFVYLSVINSAMFVNNGIDIFNRSVPNFWKFDAELINGPALDLYSMIGMSLIPVIIYGKTQEIRKRVYIIIITISSILACSALFTSLALQGRKTFLNLLVVLLLTTLFKINKIKKVSTKYIFVLAILLISTILIFNLGAIMDSSLVFTRFREEGIESGRYETWLEVIESMPNNLFGGRSFRISNSYAHNIWLDVFYDGGFLPMILLLIFHILHIVPLLKVLSSKLPDILIICVICVSVSFLIGFQGEPVLQASVFYFSMSCCFFGLIMRLSQITDKYKFDINKP